MLHTSPRREESRVDSGQNHEREAKFTKFIKDLVPVWPPPKDQVLQVSRIAVLVVVVLLSVLLYVISFLVDKTVWDLLKVLAVPITVGAAVPLLNWLQKKRELEIAEQRAEADREAAKQRAQDEDFQAYLDKMSELLADKDRPLRKAQGFSGHSSPHAAGSSV
jgi:hypothetical protein